MPIQLNQLIILSLGVIKQKYIYNYSFYEEFIITNVFHMSSHFILNHFLCLFMLCISQQIIFNFILSQQVSNPVIDNIYDYHLYYSVTGKNMNRMRLQRLKNQKKSAVGTSSSQYGTRKTMFFPDITLTNRNVRRNNSLSYQYSQVKKKCTADRYEKSQQFKSYFQRDVKSCKSSIRKQHRNQPIKLIQGDIPLFKANLQQINMKKSLVKSVAWNSYIGSKQRNEDRVFLNFEFQFSGKLFPFFAIFDGHGGSSTCQFLYNNAFKMFQKNIKLGYSVKQSLQNCLEQAERRIQTLYELNKKDKSGSCVLICVVDCDQLYVANIGDSRAIRVDLKGSVKQLTTDHKPQNERERIEKEGGKLYRVKLQNQQSVGPYRVWPAKLSVSRTIGDISIKKQEFGSSISSTPQILSYPLNAGSKIVLMSDGGYECLSNQHIASYFKNSKNIAQAVNRTISSAVSNGSTDNISILALQIV